ncbi:MAG: LysR substrate-binding domain-containing protein [Solibacillus sp.]
MELRLLEYFLAVCEYQHFTKAAETLRISQPTLSHQIKLLESYVGTPLFKRVGRKTYITQAGHILLGHSQKVFYELDQANLKIKEIQGLKRGKLSISCSGNHLITPSVISFNQKYPEIELSIQALTTEETITGLLNNEVNLGVIFDEIQNDQIDFSPLFMEEFFIVVSAQHELAQLEAISFKELNSIPLTFLTQRYLIRQFIDQLCIQEGFSLRPKIELNSLDSLLEMIQFNKFATILPHSYLESRNNVTIKKIPIVNPKPQKTIGLVYRKNAYKDSTMDAFINHLLQSYNVTFN